MCAAVPCRRVCWPALSQLPATGQEPLCAHHLGILVARKPCTHLWEQPCDFSWSRSSRKLLYLNLGYVLCSMFNCNLKFEFEICSRELTLPRPRPRTRAQILMIDRGASARRAPQAPSGSDSSSSRYSSPPRAATGTACAGVWPAWFLMRPSAPLPCSSRAAGAAHGYACECIARWWSGVLPARSRA